MAVLRRLADGRARRDRRCGCATWTFAVADQDGNGHDDVYAVNDQAATGTEVHVLDGELGHVVLRSEPAREPSTGEQRWSFDLA